MVVNLFAPKTSTGRILSGWIYAEIRIDEAAFDNSHSYSGLYVQMEDENANAIGQFVNPDLPAGNPICTTENVKPLLNDYFTPCAQAGPQDIEVQAHFATNFFRNNSYRIFLQYQVPNAVFYVSKDQMQTSKMYDVANTYYGDVIYRKINLLWRLSHTSCNKPEKIRLRLVFFKAR